MRLDRVLLLAPLFVLPFGTEAEGAVATSAKAEQKETARKCRERRRSFAEGVRHFERREWPQAVSKMRGSLIGECEKGVTVVVPYGRWVYDYTPGVYLGVALAKAADCRETICLRSVEWWRELDDEEARALVECAACARATGPKTECTLGLDWWRDLAAGGEDASDVRERYDEDCIGLSDVFTRVFTRRDPYVQTCKDLVAELNQTLEACREIRDWPASGR